MPSKGGSSASSSEERSSSTSRLTDVTKAHEKWTFLNIRSCLNFLQDCGFLHLFAFEWCKVCGISTLWSLCLKGWPSKKSFIQTTGFKMMRKNNTKVWCFISDYSSSPAPSKGEQQLELVLVFRGIQKCDGYSKAYDTPRVHIFQHLFSNPSGTQNRNPDENSPKITTTSSAEAPAFCRSKRRSPTRQFHLTSCVPQKSWLQAASRWLKGHWTG